MSGTYKIKTVIFFFTLNLVVNYKVLCVYNPQKKTEVLEFPSAKQNDIVNVLLVLIILISRTINLMIIKIVCFSFL